MKVSCIFLIVLYTENKENVFFLLVGIGCGCNRSWCGLICVWVVWGLCGSAGYGKKFFCDTERSLLYEKEFYTIYER